MSLTKADVLTITDIIKTTVPPIVSVIVNKVIDELRIEFANGFTEVHKIMAKNRQEVDELRIEVANGFAEVHEIMAQDREYMYRIGNEVGDLKNTTGRIENKLNAVVRQGDDHSLRIGLVEKKLA